MTTSIQKIGQEARQAYLKLSATSRETRDSLLLAIRDRILANRPAIAQANQKDLDQAKQLVEQGQLSQALYNRLVLQGKKIDQLATYMEEVAQLADPLGKKQYAMKLAEGLELERVTCPIGVVAVIFEARPEVVVQVAALALKSGNGVILKGGREAAESNRFLFGLIDQVLAEKGFQGAVSLIETREDVTGLLSLDEHLDLIIPRGSNDFVRYIQNNTRIPVLGHSAGICHLYVDQAADPAMAVELALDSKLDYPSACNAVETLLLHQALPTSLVTKLLQSLAEKGVTLRLDAGLLDLAQGQGISAQAATEEDWDTEYGDLELSLKQVASFEEAVQHINRHGSHHTDSIVTADEQAAQAFLAQVDSGCVFHNASTRFSDGYVFGLGAEVGISTNKTHSRGPVGLEGMVIYKYQLKGSGQVRGKFSSGQLKYLHQPLPLD